MGKFRALERAPLTKDWSIDERAALAHFLTERRVAEGDPIFLPQSKERVLYFIESGAVDIHMENLHTELKEGDSFGELSLLAETGKLVGATAKSACVLWTLNFEKYLEMKKTTPLVSVRLSESITLKLVKLLALFHLPQRLSPGSAAANPAQLSKSSGSHPRPPAL